MSTSVVLIPSGQELYPITRIERFLVFELSDSLIYPVRNRPVMPGVRDYQRCTNRDAIRRLAHGVILSDHATEETEEEGDS